ncbi:hypothetical protein [Telluribacter sp. SYSU D00476]|uniref:hypothetical protein n=1 Tax=Telluribacter sp. SYSU D00476 TaxID=2811430 RepID=UPI001FF62D80|nr:hypothetical protein [Telluribacter sp. SYSU D00476]
MENIPTALEVSGACTIANINETVYVYIAVISYLNIQSSSTQKLSNLIAMKALNRDFKPVHLIFAVFAILALLDIANAGYHFGIWLKNFLE